MLETTLMAMIVIVCAILVIIGFIGVRYKEKHPEKFEDISDLNGIGSKEEEFK